MPAVTTKYSGRLSRRHSLPGRTGGLENSGKFDQALRLAAENQGGLAQVKFTELVINGIVVSLIPLFGPCDKWGYFSSIPLFGPTLANEVDREQGFGAGCASAGRGERWHHFQAHNSFCIPLIWPSRN